LDEIERGFGRQVAFKRYLESLLIQCERLKNVKKHHEKYIGEQKKFKEECRRMTLKEEHNRMQKVIWEWEWRMQGEARLENVCIGYFSFFRKIFFVRNSLREEDETDGCFAKINKELNAVSEAFKKFTSDNEFFLNEPVIKPNPSVGELSGCDVNAGNICNFFNHRITDVRSCSPDYEFDVRNIIRFVNKQSRMKSMMQEVQHLSKKLTHNTRCKICLNKVEKELNLLNSKYDFENIKDKIPKIVASENELRESIEKFDEKYHALYVFNTSTVESFEYGNGQVETPFCAICLKYFRTGKPVAKLHCGHFFHKKCFVKWVGEKHSQFQPPTCPMCRGNSFL